ncbi:MAG: 3-hydroxyacyl-CoA dehydrogenase [Betaproteobacteria bacterium]|nr:3-hydroxyacyl-CoA dehydrogenase [Betaproteobacteria bacterium]
MTNVVTYHVQNHVGVISLNNPPVNALAVNKGVVQGIMDCIQEGEHDPDVRAFVVAGAGKAFSAGADITEFSTVRLPDAVTLPALLAYMDTVTKPLVAAVHGFAMGGGLELALACHYRVAAPGARFALPEVKLGILPGAGGTQRLPRLIGVERALDMIITGDTVDTEAARKLGLVDEVAPGELVRAAVSFANGLVKEARELRRISTLQPRLEQAATVFFEQARARIAKDYRGFPAPLACLQCVENAVYLPFAQGVTKERELFYGLRDSTESKALRHLFFAEREAAKIADVPDDTPVLPLKRAGVLGAGTMGGGIAMNFLNAGIPVTLVEMNQEALDRGVALIRKNYAGTVAKGRLTQAAMDQRLSLLTATIEDSALADVDIVIEAVFEDMELKKSVFGKLDAVCKRDAVLATNTSTLDINEIAAATTRPGKVIGLHFFSPAHVMKLLEVVRGAATDKQTLASSMKLAKTLGKVGVVAGVCDGFIGNRMLHKYTRETHFLLEEGATPRQIDNVLEQFGFAMGPFRVGDLAGLDVSWRIRQRRAATRPANERYSRIADRICERGRFGQKTGAGWYRYETGSRSPIVDDEVQAIIAAASAEAGITRREISDTEVLDRCLYALVNEGARLLDEGIAQRASDIDITYAFGYGFPRYRGGPMFYANTIGLDKVHETVARFHRELGEWWAPSSLLEQRALEGGRFD